MKKFEFEDARLNLYELEDKGFGIGVVSTVQIITGCAYVHIGLSKNQLLELAQALTDVANAEVIA